MYMFEYSKQMLKQMDKKLFTNLSSKFLSILTYGLGWEITKSIYNYTFYLQTRITPYNNLLIWSYGFKIIPQGTKIPLVCS